MRYLLALDLETTGLQPGWNEITQIGAIILDRRLTKISNFESLVRIRHPERGISERNGKEFNVFEYTGIDPAELELAPEPEEVYTDFCNWVKDTTRLSNLRRISIFGQNPKFDYDFLKAGFEENEIMFPFDYHVLGLDSVYAFYHLIKHGELPEKVGQVDICRELNIINPKEHNAMSDIVTACDLFQAITQDIKEKIYE